MKAHRVMAVVMRHVYLFPRSFDRITDAFFWPILDILLWGMAGKWLTESQPQDASVITALLCALLLWRVVWHTTYEVGINLLEECWNRNLTNLFSSPLTKLEWLAANLIVGLVKVVIIVAVGAAAAWLLYHANLFAPGWMWLPYFASLLVSGWALGCFTSALVLRWGIRVQALIWTIAFILAPISAVYFPVRLLPEALQYPAYLLPTTYIFEGLRALLIEHRQDYRLLEASALLNIAYFALSLWFINLMFEKTREHGFDDLE